MAGPIPHEAAPYEEFFSWSSRHHCPMEVGAFRIVTLSRRHFAVALKSCCESPDLISGTTELVKTLRKSYENPDFEAS